MRAAKRLRLRPALALSSQTLSSCSSIRRPSIAASDPAPLATEALRGEGAILVNRDGKRFMQALHKDAELGAARYRGARRVRRNCRGPRRVPRLPRKRSARISRPRSRPFMRLAKAAGIDPVTDLIPVAPAAHYHMGGVATDANGRTSVAGFVGGRRSGLHRAAWRQSVGLEFACSKPLCSARVRPAIFARCLPPKLSSRAPNWSASNATAWPISITAPRH